ncbi:uncharacterized protein [Oscarella lobularis]|uniref:uncharacterized protein isoform X2 n=1 Tax=Oscarella lobularis TaxID=121494 RepID=UPI003313DDC2
MGETTSERSRLLWALVFLFVAPRSVFQQNPCDSNPCQNGGICSNKTTSEFECECRPTLGLKTFGGVRCENVTCDAEKDCNAPNGLCNSLPEQPVRCRCSGLFLGPQCAVSARDPCLRQNGALNCSMINQTCVGNVTDDSFRCVPPPPPPVVPPSSPPSSTAAALLATTAAIEPYSSTPFAAASTTTSAVPSSVPASSTSAQIDILPSTSAVLTRTSTAEIALVSSVPASSSSAQIEILPSTSAVFQSMSTTRTEVAPASSSSAQILPSTSAVVQPTSTSKPSTAVSAATSASEIQVVPTSVQPRASTSQLNDDLVRETSTANIVQSTPAAASSVQPISPADTSTSEKQMQVSIKPSPSAAVKSTEKTMPPLLSSSEFMAPQPASSETTSSQPPAEMTVFSAAPVFSSQPAAATTSAAVGTPKPTPTIEPGCTPPCLNGGSCSPIDSLENDFTCLCPESFTGVDCSSPVGDPLAGDDGLENWEIALIVVGATVAFVLLLLFLIWLYNRNANSKSYNFKKAEKLNEIPLTITNPEKDVLI